MAKKTGAMFLSVAWRGRGGGGVDNPMHTISMYNKRRMILLQKVPHPLEMFRVNKYLTFLVEVNKKIFLNRISRKNYQQNLPRFKAFFSIWVSFYLIFINHRTAEGIGQS